MVKKIVAILDSYEYYSIRIIKDMCYQYISSRASGGSREAANTAKAAPPHLSDVLAAPCMIFSRPIHDSKIHYLCVYILIEKNVKLCSQ